eukprot:5147686-Pyramimonas_sp.AAC.1
MHMPQQLRQSGVARSFWFYTEETNNKDVKRVWNASSKDHAVEQRIIRVKGLNPTVIHCPWVRG